VVTEFDVGNQTVAADFLSMKPRVNAASRSPQLFAVGW